MKKEILIVVGVFFLSNSVFPQNSPFTVNSTSGQSNTSLTSNIGYGAMLKLQRFGNATNYYAIETGAGSNDDLRIHINNNWNLPLMSFKPTGEVVMNGNVGMGTTSPGAWFPGKTLEILDGRPILKLSSSAPGGISTLLFTNQSINPSNHHGEFHVNYVHNQTDATQSRLSFNGYPGSESLNILATGNVGIGTATPGVKLAVTGLGGVNTDLAVNGRIHTGDASNSGGVWVSGPGSNMFMGQVSPSAMGWYNNGQWRMIADNNGNVGIGTTSPTQKLTVNGTIYGKEVKVDLNVPGPDYVFAKDYALPSLDSVQSYINQNYHLPEVPSAKEMEANGINLSEMNMILLKKVEELTLYVIELKHRDEAQQKEIEQLKKK